MRKIKKGGEKRGNDMKKERKKEGKKKSRGEREIEIKQSCNQNKLKLCNQIYAIM